MPGWRCTLRRPKLLRRLVRILQDKARAHRNERIVKTVGCLYARLVGIAKVRFKIAKQRNIAPRKPKDRLPVIANAVKFNIRILLYLNIVPEFQGLPLEKEVSQIAY